MTTKLELWDKTIEEDAEEILDFIRPFIFHFYDSQHSFSINSIFNGEACRLCNNHNYKTWFLKFDDGREYIYNSVKEQIKYHQVDRYSFNWPYKTHSSLINKPTWYVYGIEGKSRIAEHYNYHGLKVSDHWDWLHERELSLNDWTVEDYLAFTLEFANKY
jgi:hypothetical protein